MSMSRPGREKRQAKKSLPRDAGGACRTAERPDLASEGLDGGIRGIYQRPPLCGGELARPIERLHLVDKCAERTDGGVRVAFGETVLCGIQLGLRRLPVTWKQSACVDERLNRQLQALYLLLRSERRFERQGC